MNEKRFKEELQKKVTEFEKNHHEEEFYLNENDPLVHSMKMKGELFSMIEMDEEFERVELFDLLGIERIICKKNK